MAKEKPVPVKERWDCHGCGDCCVGLQVDLTADDLRRLREQAWHRHPEFRRVRVVRRERWFGKTRTLAQRRDGSCVFLSSDKRCRIHQEFGADAKPLVCRMYPLQFVQLGDAALFCTQRSCPSAAGDRGRELELHLDAFTELARQDPSPEAEEPPSISANVRRTWPETRALFDAIERVTQDTRLPLRLRILRGLEFCRRLEAVENGIEREFRGTIESLEAGVIETVTMGDVPPPDPDAAREFRETALDYLCLDGDAGQHSPIQGRWQVLRAWPAFKRGTGRVPRVLPDQPEATFEELEQPPAAIEATIVRPIERYFTASIASRQFALFTRGEWSVVDNFRALGLACAVAGWTVRLAFRSRDPRLDTVIRIVAAIDRAHGQDLLAGAYHRRRVQRLAQRKIDRLVAHYVGD